MHSDDIEAVKLQAQTAVNVAAVFVSQLDTRDTDVAKRKGLSVPEQLQICGFGDGKVAKVSDPSLTTVEQNGYAMGVEACKMLINRIENGNDMKEVTHSVIRTNLIVRESTR